nr:hypothetical protein [uncultured Pseudomonas sp.]
MLSTETINARPPNSTSVENSQASNPQQPIARAQQPIPHSAENEVSGDSKLSSLYAAALRQGATKNVMPTHIDNIPSDSSFGKWWSHFHDAIKSPQFTEWAKGKNIDLSKPIELYPATDQMTVTINGQREALIGREQDIMWPVVVAPVMRAAAIIGAERAPAAATTSDINEFFYSLSVRNVTQMRWSTTPNATLVMAPTSNSSAPLEAVESFYGASRPLYTKEALETRAAELEGKKSFNELSSLDVERLAHDRSDDALVTEKIALADTQNKHMLRNKLQNIPGRDPQQIADYLKTTTIDVHPNSSYALTQENQDTNTVSLENFILGSGWSKPAGHLQVADMILALKSPSLSEPAHGDLGGGFSWPVPLDQESQKLVFNQVYFNGEDLVSGLGEQQRDGKQYGALGYLANGFAFDSADLSHPRRAIERLIHSEKGQRLGKALQEKMGGAETEGSAQDWALTAIMATLDSQSVFSPRLHHTAGFCLEKDDLHGLPLAQVKRTLEDKLTRDKRTTSEVAPLGAYLLLSRAAPELLIKDTPSNVVYGSPSWMSLRAAVKFIEAQAPGASSHMSFAQVMEYANLPALSSEEQTLRNAFTNESLLLWGKLNGLITKSHIREFTPEDLKLCQEKLNQQVGELSKIPRYLMAPMPTRRVLALENLKEAYGDKIPFEKNFLQSTTGGGMDDHFFSPLDAYMSDQLHLPQWRSIDSKQSVDVFKGPKLLNPNWLFEKRFDEYHSALKVNYKNLLKNMFSKLPEEDRKHLEHGKQEFYYLRPAIEGHYTHLIPESEAKSAKGLGGVLIRSELGEDVRYYEVFPNSMLIRKRTDLPKKLSLGGVPDIRNIEINRTHALDWEAYKTGKPPREQTTTSEILVYRLPPNKEWVAESPGTSSVTAPMSYFGKKTEYLAEIAASQHFTPDYELSKNGARGESGIEKTERIYKSGQEFLLGLIPFKNAIESAIKGDAAESIMLFIMDGMSFIAPGVKAAGILGKVGTSGAVKAISIAKIAGGAVLAAANPAGGMDDLVRLIGNGGQKLVSTGLQGLSRLTGTAQSVDLIKLAQRADIAEVAVKSADGVSQYRTLAKVDNRTGKVFRYSAKADKVYGRPLEGFSMNPGGANDRTSLLGRQLAADNVIDMGGAMRELKALDKEIFTFVNDVQGTSRLTIVAHGWERNPLKKLFSLNPTVSDSAGKLFNIGSTVSDSVGKSYSPAQFLELLKKSGIDPQKYDSIRFVTCFSGEAGTHSFAAKFKELTGKPVAAFEGTVTVNRNDFEMPFQFNLDMAKAKNPNADGQSLLSAAEEKLKKDFEGVMDRILRVDTEHNRVDKISILKNGKYIDDKQVINYRPTFYGTKPWNTAG